MTASPLPSISVDSRPLLRVYYSQPPTLLSSPAISLLSLCGSYPQSQERSKSFTELQSARERHRRREKQTYQTVPSQTNSLSGSKSSIAVLSCTAKTSRAVTALLSLQVKLICIKGGWGSILHTAICPLQQQLHRFHCLISYVHLFCHHPYIFRGERVAFAHSSFPLFMAD